MQERTKGYLGGALGSRTTRDKAIHRGEWRAHFYAILMNPQENSEDDAFNQATEKRRQEKMKKSDTY